MANRRRRSVRGRQSGFAGLVLFALLALAIGVLLKSQVFIIRNIEVEGVTTVSPASIIRKSGLTLGSSVFAVDETEIRRQFESEGLISFERVERHLPGTIRLIVKERVRRALVNYLGVALVIDDQGYVMEQLGEMPSYDLTVVTGVRASSYQTGHKLESATQLQVESLLSVLEAIQEQGLSDRVTELNVADLDNMYLMERGGMMVKIGDEQNLADKLLWMQSVLDQQLYSQGINTGTLDVSSGNNAVYVPE